ncbi:MAG: type II toxin-antitoxin system VapC family toxin [Deferrisomatales bacterium]
MILYLDTSSLVKLYVREEHSEAVEGWVEEAEILATSVVAYVEALSAFARRCRRSDLGLGQRDALAAGLRKHWPHYLVLPVNETRAGELAMRHALRAFDAVHLAAALSVRDRPQIPQLRFSSFDRALNRAARAERLDVVAPDAYQ